MTPDRDSTGPPSATSLAVLVRALREQALLTQEDLARQTGLSVGTVRGLEAGRVGRPRSSSLRLLVDALAVTEADRQAMVAAARGERAAEPTAPGPPPAPGRPGAPGPDRPVPRGLPGDVAGFTGRADARTALDDLLPDPAGAPGSPVIAAIAGTAGVGKTALAVHWAHRVADRFPDGQLYVDLRGFATDGAPVEPAQAVRGLLEKLLVAPQQIPAGVDAQVGLYRSLLAQRRILVLLDNARDAEQVRPLLPGSPGCLVVVTSRDQLAGLVASDGAWPLTLDLLPSTEAWDMLDRRLGRERATAEPHAVQEIASRCAGLPLALAIVAARAAAHPDFPLVALVDQLREVHTGLDALAGGDPATDVRAVFSWSYGALGHAPARLFRLLGLHPGVDVSVTAAASIAGLPPAEVRPLLAELSRAHLVREHVPDRFSMHDLLRAYATELMSTIDSMAERQAARHRMLDHYLHTAHAAALRLRSSRRPIALPSPVSGATPEQPSSPGAALAWLTAEHPTLLTAVALADESGFDTHAWQLGWTLEDFLDRRGRWRDLATAVRAGLRAAGRQHDPTGQAEAHRGLARPYIRLGRHDDARTHLQLAAGRYGTLSDRTGQAQCAACLAEVLESQGHHAAALRQLRRALDLYAAEGHRVGQANTLNDIGWYHTRRGDHWQALAYCQRALRLSQQVGDLEGEAASWDSLGFAHHHLGHHQQAVSCYQQAIDILRDLDDRHREAEALTRLGDAHDAAGHPEAAARAWRRARTISDELDHHREAASRPPG